MTRNTVNRQFAMVSLLRHEKKEGVGSTFGRRCSIVAPRISIPASQHNIMASGEKQGASEHKQQKEVGDTVDLGNGVFNHV